MSWFHRFDDPIPLPHGRALIALKEAAEYIQKLPKAEQQLEEWQAAVEALLVVELAARHDGAHWPAESIEPKRPAGV